MSFAVAIAGPAKMWEKAPCSICLLEQRKAIVDTMWFCGVTRRQCGTCGTVPIGSGKYFNVIDTGGSQRGDESMFLKMLKMQNR